MTDRRQSGQQEYYDVFLGGMIPGTLDERLEDYLEEQDHNNRSKALRDLLDRGLNDYFQSEFKRS